MKRFAVLSVIGTLFTTPASPQELISPEAFLDVAEGKTLTFHLFGDGTFVGVEEYLSRTLSAWRDSTGKCVYGQITIENGQLCFLYDDNTDGFPACWWNFRDGDRLLVMTNSFGDREIQEVVEISEEGVSCPIIPSV